MRVISEYFFRRVSLLVLIALLSSCGGGGGGDNAPNYIGGSNLTSSRATISRTYDTNGSRRFGGVSIGWKSFNVSKIVVGMPPGQTQPPWLDVSVTGRNSPVTVAAGVKLTNTSGVFQTTIRVTSVANDNQLMDFIDIAVRIEIIDKPTASPVQLTFDMVEGSIPDKQTVTLSRQSSVVKILDTTAVFNARLAQNSQNYANPVINGESVDVVFNNNALLLEVGAYVPSLQIDYNGGRWAIPIRLNVISAITVPAQVNFNINQNALAADKTVDITIASGLPKTINWQVSFSENWMALSSAAGDTTTPNNLKLTLVQSELDTLRSGSYTGIISVSSVDAGITPVQIPVTLKMTFPEVSYVAPYQANSNTSAEVILRGLGYTALLNPVVTFGGNAALSTTVISDTEIRATHDVLLAGAYAVELTATNNTFRSFATLEVIDPISYSAFWNTTPGFGNLSDIIFNPLNEKLYTIGIPGFIGSYSRSGINWISTSGISDSRLKFGGVARTPDGQFFYGEAISDTVRVDASTLVLETIFDDGNAGIRSGFKRAAFANNGVMLLTNSYQNDSSIYKYNYLNKTNTTIFNARGLKAERVAKASLDGSRIYFVNQSTSSAVYLYDTSADQLTATSIMIQSSHITVDRTGNKLIIGNAVYDSTGKLLGTLPITALTNVITADGNIAYTIETDLTGVTFRKYDLLKSDGAGGFLEIGLGTLVAGPQITAPIMTLSLDGGTLFVLSNNGFQVQPVP